MNNNLDELISEAIELFNNIGDAVELEQAQRTSPRPETAGRPSY